MLKWILAPLALPFVANAAIPTLPAATSFYRSPDSQFTSGQASRANLEKALQRNEYELIYRVKWDGKTYGMKAAQLLRDIQCSSTIVIKENMRLLDDRRSDAHVLAELTTGTEASLIETRDAWARVKVKGRDGWIPMSRLEAKMQDAGLFVPLIDTFLRQKPENGSKIETTVPRGARLRLVAIDGGWGRASWGTSTGFVDLQHVVGRADFAVWAYHRKRGWLGVNRREGGVLKIIGGADASLTDILAYSPNTHKGVVNQTESSSLPPLRAHVELKKTEATLWGISWLSDHGEVWWKRESMIMEDLADDRAVLSNDQLLARDVYSYAVSGTKKLEGLVSSRGIYRTSDGLRWEKIPQFADQDMPVALAANGDWFVGAYRSLDKGRTFEPFIRWDSLTHSIEAKLLRPPRYVKIQKIETLPNSQVQILVDTGVRRLSLRSNVETNSWR